MITNASSQPDLSATEATRRRYQRLLHIYDAMKRLAERGYHSWRTKLWSQVPGLRVLEVGIGTGKNMPFYPADISITGIDLTSGMLQQAQKRVAELGLKSGNLHLGDAQELNFPNAAFESAVAALVFCSVPGPVLGLRELKRVVRPGGHVLLLELLERMRSPYSMVGTLMDFLNPVIVRMLGANINRETVENVRKAGLEIEQVGDLGTGRIFKLIAARVPRHRVDLSQR